MFESKTKCMFLVLCLVFVCCLLPFCFSKGLRSFPKNPQSFFTIPLSNFTCKCITPFHQQMPKHVASIPFICNHILRVITYNSILHSHLHVISLSLLHMCLHVISSCEPNYTITSSHYYMLITLHVIESGESEFGRRSLFKHQSRHLHTSISIPTCILGHINKNPSLPTCNPPLRVQFWPFSPKFICVP